MKTLFTMISLALTLALPVAVGGTSAKCDMAVSFDVGLVNAFDNDFDDIEPVPTGTFQYYTSRSSRGGACSVSRRSTPTWRLASVDGTARCA